MLVTTGLLTMGLIIKFHPDFVQLEYKYFMRFSESQRHLEALKVHNYKVTFSSF